MKTQITVSKHNYAKPKDVTGRALGMVYSVSYQNEGQTQVNQSPSVTNETQYDAVKKCLAVVLRNNAVAYRATDVEIAGCTLSESLKLHLTDIFEGESDQISSVVFV